MRGSNLDDYITMPLNDFCHFTGLGRTLARQMISDGRLRAVRIGAKRLLVDIAIYRELIAKQAADGVPEYNAPAKAIAARKAKIAERRAANRNETPSLEDLGL